MEVVKFFIVLGFSVFITHKCVALYFRFCLHIFSKTNFLQSCWWQFVVFKEFLIYWRIMLCGHKMYKTSAIHESAWYIWRNNSPYYIICIMWICHANLTLKYYWLEYKKNIFCILFLYTDEQKKKQAYSNDNFLWLVSFINLYWLFLFINNGE